MSPVAVGIDVGGTKMLGVVVDAEDPSIVRCARRVPTPHGVDALVDGLAELVADLTADMAEAAHAPVGLGIPGLVTLDERFLAGPNLPNVVDVPLAALLMERLGRAVTLDNDANCAARAEFRIGVGAGVRHGILVTLGTGIGSGIVTDGEILRGANGLAGEAGHMLIDPGGPACPCGRRGCWERHASGSGLGRMGRDAAIAGRLPGAVADVGGDPEAVKGEHVVEAARRGDVDAGRVLDQYAWWVAAGLANLVNLTDPELIVLAGGVIESADVVLYRVRDALPGQIMSDEHRPAVRVEAAEFGERAGAVGAAILSIDR